MENYNNTLTSSSSSVSNNTQSSRQNPSTNKDIKLPDSESQQLPQSNCRQTLRTNKPQSQRSASSSSKPENNISVVPSTGNILSRKRGKRVKHVKPRSHDHSATNAAVPHRVCTTIFINVDMFLLIYL